LVGVDAFPVEVEIDIGAGMPPHRLVGLAEGAVKEALDRVKSALKNSGFDFPTRKMTINLAPADTRKEGSAFDLPLALGILAAQNVLKDRARLRAYLVLGELPSTAVSKASGARCRPRCSRALPGSRA